MELLLHVGCLAIGVVGLYYGADLLVKGSVRVAKRAGVSSLVIGLTLVACGTSMPELVVSVNAAIQNKPDISLGNIVGSNICNVGLILGLSALIAPLAVHRNLLKFDAPVMCLTSLLLAGFYFLSRGVTRWEALVMLILFIAYTVWTIFAAKRAEAASEPEKNRKPDDDEMESKRPLSLGTSLLLAAVGLGLLVFSSSVFVHGATGIAKILRVGEAIIGLTIVAVGTSLPELATSVVAAIKGERDIAIGNVVGSNIFNILGILGIAPLLRPIRDSNLSMIDLGTMVFFSVILLPIMLTGKRINRAEGALLLLFYVAYAAFLCWQEAT